MTLFDIYRRLLVITISVYGVVRTVHFIWRWELSTREAGRTESLMRRYLVTLFVRTRARHHAWEMAQILAIVALLAYLLKLHGRI